MNRHRERRIRRKFRAKLRSLERQLDAERVRDYELVNIANVAIEYIQEINAPDLREPYSIANKRDRLKHTVNAYLARKRATAAARRAA